MNRTFFWLLLIIAGCQQKTQPEKQPPTGPEVTGTTTTTEEISFDEFKSSDPQTERLAKLFPGYKWDWSITNDLLWSNYQCSGQDENETFQAFMMGFKFRESSLTDLLASTVQELSQEWMKSDRKNFVERSKAGWIVSVTGGNDNGFFLRAAIKRE